MVDAVRSEYRIINRFRPNEKFDSKKLDPEGDGASDADQLYYVDKYPEQFSSPTANVLTREIADQILVGGVTDTELDEIVPFDPTGDAAVAHLGLLNGKFTPKDLAGRIRQDLGLDPEDPITAEHVFTWAARVYDNDSTLNSGTKRSDLPPVTIVMIDNGVETRNVGKAQDLFKEVVFDDELKYDTLVPRFDSSGDLISSYTTGPESYIYSIGDPKFRMMLSKWANKVFYGVTIKTRGGQELKTVLDPKIRDRDVREFGLYELLIRNATKFKCADGSTLERNAEGKWILRKLDGTLEDVPQDKVAGLLGTFFEILEIDLNGLYDDLELFGLDFNRDSFISSFGQDATIIRDPKTGKIIEARVSFKEFTKALQHDYVKFMEDPAGLDIRAHTSNVYGRDAYFDADPASYKLWFDNGWIDENGHLTDEGTKILEADPDYGDNRKEAEGRMKKERFLWAAMGGEGEFDSEARIAYHLSDIYFTSTTSALAVENDIPYADMVRMMYSTNPAIRTKANDYYMERLRHPDSSNTKEWQELHKDWIDWGGRAKDKRSAKVDNPNEVTLSRVWEDTKKELVKLESKIKELV